MVVPPTRAISSVGLRRLRLIAVIATVVSLGAFLVLVSLRSFEDPTGPGPHVGALGLTATLVFSVVFLIPLGVRRLDVRVASWWPWLVGGVSICVALAGWTLIAMNTALGQALYRGLKVPQGIVQFWDLRLILETIDCARWGFDVYAPNNGCLTDPSIYGPGILWAQHLHPIFSEQNTDILGLLGVIISGLALVWIARQTRGVAALVLLVAALGAPWQLLIERGNLDAVVLWCAVGVAIVTRRWNNYWVWILAAAAIWFVGTWKYYPFVLAVLLLPTLRLRHGWLVLGGFSLATVAFFALTWRNVQMSLLASSEMTEFGDFVVLGRVPVVERLPELWPFGNALFGLIVFSAVLWGWSISRGTQRSTQVRLSPLHLLALSGALLYLSSVAMTGFGYGYKATFLLLAVPILVIRRADGPFMRWSLLTVVALSVVSFVVVWNTVLATLAGTLVACVVLGMAGYVLLLARDTLANGMSFVIQRDNVRRRA